MRFHSRSLNSTPYSRRGTGDFVPGKLLQPYNPVTAGMGDLTPAALLTPWNPFMPRAGMGHLGCATCSNPQGMGDLTLVMGDLEAGEFTQAWADWQSYMTTLFGSLGPYITPVAGVGILALTFLGGSSKGGRKRR